MGASSYVVLRVRFCYPNILNVIDSMVLDSPDVDVLVNTARAVRDGLLFERGKASCPLLVGELFDHGNEVVDCLLGCLNMYYQSIAKHFDGFFEL